MSKAFAAAGVAVGVASSHIVDQRHTAAVEAGRVRFMAEERGWIQGTLVKKSTPRILSSAA